MTRLATALALLLLFGMLASFAFAIWTGDVRWSQMALLFFVPAIAATVWAVASRMNE